MTEEQLARVRDLLGRVPAGPWRWNYGYGMGGGRTHWCLESDETAEDGRCLDGQLVTATTQQFDVRDDVAQSQVPLSDRPLWRFLAESWETVTALLAAVEERDAIIHDLQLDGEAYRLGRATELGGVLATLKHLREEYTLPLPRNTLGDAIEVVRTRHDIAPQDPLPPDRARAEIDRLRGVLERIASYADDDLPGVAALAREALRVHDGRPDSQTV